MGWLFGLNCLVTYIGVGIFFSVDPTQLLPPGEVFARFCSVLVLRPFYTPFLWVGSMVLAYFARPWRQKLWNRFRSRYPVFSRFVFWFGLALFVLPFLTWVYATGVEPEAVRDVGVLLFERWSR